MSDLKLLAEGRMQLDRINADLLTLLAQRFATVERIGEAKKRMGLPARDLAREDEMLARLEGEWAALEISKSVPWTYAERVLRTLFESSAALQER